MTDTLTALFSICAPSQHDKLRLGAGLAAMLMLGLTGSLLHCGPMCGPLVLGQAAGRMACLSCNRMSEARRLRSGLLLRYHAGRLTTYALLGAIAGAAGQGLTAALQPFRLLLLLALATVFLLTAWRSVHLLARPDPRRLPAARPPAASSIPARLRGWFAGCQRRMLARVAPGGLAYGLVLGLLPCGLVYTALLAASATASLVKGAAWMAMFGAGTVPLLALLGVAGTSRRVAPWLRRGAPVFLTVCAALLFIAVLKAPA